MSNNNSGGNNEVYTEEYIQQCKDLCEKYCFEYINASSYGNYHREAMNRNITLEEYFKWKHNIRQIKEEKQKRQNEFLKKHNREGYNFGRLLANAHKMGFEYSDNFRDLENYFAIQMYFPICKRFGLKSVHSDPNHNIHYKTKTRLFKSENMDLVEFLEENIIGFNVLKNLNINNNNSNNKNKICGIYFWLIDDVPYYIGQSIDIPSRSYDHIREMFIHLNHWLNIIKEIEKGKHTLTIDFIEYLKEEFDERELELINTLKPISQKCDGTDNYKHLNKRKYSLNNLRKEYERQFI